MGFVKIMLELKLRNSGNKGVLKNYNVAMTTFHLIKMTMRPLDKSVGICLVST